MKYRYALSFALGLFFCVNLCYATNVPKHIKTFVKEKKFIVRLSSAPIVSGPFQDLNSSSFEAVKVIETKANEAIEAIEEIGSKTIEALKSMKAGTQADTVLGISIEAIERKAKEGIEAIRTVDANSSKEEAKAAKASQAKAIKAIKDVATIPLIRAGLTQENIKFRTTTTLSNSGNPCVKTQYVFNVVSEPHFWAIVDVLHKFGIRVESAKPLINRESVTNKAQNEGKNAPQPLRRQVSGIVKVHDSNQTRPMASLSLTRE